MYVYYKFIENNLENDPGKVKSQYLLPNRMIIVVGVIIRTLYHPHIAYQI